MFKNNERNLYLKKIGVVVTLSLMTIEDGYQRLFSQIREKYDRREAGNIADLVVEHLTGYKPTQRIIYKKESLSETQRKKLERMLSEVLAEIPIQYVLGEAWFFGMPFFVDSSVLIPRPETEELVEWILAGVNEENKSLKVLDIGTGSGCIPITLKKKAPHLEVWALDKYSEALEVAQKNADALKVNIQFLKQDLMDKEAMKGLPQFDLIVSNPPYIPLHEKAKMDGNVVGKEPDSALFVPDNSPLLFYEKILALAEEKLHPEGCIFVELHEDLGKETKQLFLRKMNKVRLKRDLNGKNRMLQAVGLKQ